MKDKRNKYKWLFIISLSLNLTGGIFFLYRHYYENKHLLPAKDNRTYWMKRNELFKILPDDKDEIIFLGNSLTEQFPLVELFGNLKIKNRGINGDDTKGVLNRLDEVTESKPKKIFIEIGLNDLAMKVELDSICMNYEKIIRVILKQTPQTRIYIQSLLPVRKTNYLCGDINGSVIKLNERLKEICRRYQLTFIDLFSGFLKDDQLNPAYTIDGIHLSGEGYLLWKKLIEKEVIE